MAQNLFIIDDSSPIPVGPTGYIERDYSVYPEEMFAPPSEIPLIPESEWDARIEEQEKTESSLKHIRNRANGGTYIPSLNQGQFPFCWAYSVGMAIMLDRARRNLPYRRLSPHAVACKIKNFQEEGGWCGLSAKFAQEVGYPDKTVWPEGSMSRNYDNNQTWENAKNYRITEGWIDLTRPVYNQSLTFPQVVSCLLRNDPVALDYNWWGHSVAGLRVVKIEAGSYGIEIINSWGDSWGDNGTAILRGNRAIPNGAIGIVRTTLSAPSSK
jgi:hypothetical protein